LITLGDVLREQKETNKLLQLIAIKLDEKQGIRPYIKTEGNE
jgi:hypothetical protein